MTYAVTAGNPAVSRSTMAGAVSTAVTVQPPGRRGPGQRTAAGPEVERPAPGRRGDHAHDLQSEPGEEWQRLVIVTGHPIEERPRHAGDCSDPAVPAATALPAQENAAPAAARIR